MLLVYANQSSGGLKDMHSTEKKFVNYNSENFPVGSFLIPKDCRKHVHAFHLFARNADDISDDPHLPNAEKLKSLTAIQESLSDKPQNLPDWAKPYYYTLVETGTSAKNGKDLLSAFIQDVNKSRYANWDELMDYCYRSAASVGKVLIDIHGEKNADIEGADALCNALQVLNHLQDCKDDYIKLNRVYIPQNWLDAERSGEEELGHEQISEELRRVVNRCLVKIDALLKRAENMPNSFNRRGLRLESAVILRLAKALSYRLKREDPLSDKVKVSKLGWFWCGARGIFSSW